MSYEDDDRQTNRDSLADLKYLSDSETESCRYADVTQYNNRVLQPNS